MHRDRVMKNVSTSLRGSSGHRSVEAVSVPPRPVRVPRAATMSAQPFGERGTYKTALIPERDAVNGPVTSARLRRTGFVYLALSAAGLALAWLAVSPRQQAFGLG